LNCVLLVSPWICVPKGALHCMRYGERPTALMMGSPYPTQKELVLVADSTVALPEEGVLVEGAGRGAGAAAPRGRGGRRKPATRGRGGARKPKPKPRRKPKPKPRGRRR
jgi:hypothetical protein